jgi:hypothetical protein
MYHIIGEKFFFNPIIYFFFSQSYQREKICVDTDTNKKEILYIIIYAYFSLW